MSLGPFKSIQRALSFWTFRLSVDNFLAFQYKQRREMSRRMNRMKRQMNMKVNKGADEQILERNVGSATKRSKTERMISL